MLHKMEFDSSFWTGLGCGFCLGITVLAIKKYTAAVPIAYEAVKRFATNTEYKLVIVVRTDLKMTKGKIAAQCGHAAVDAFQKAQKVHPKGLKCWQKYGQAKVAVKTDSVDELKQIEANARKMGIITSLIQDDGRTQVAHSAITVLGVGPAPKNIVDQVTGHLKLL